MEETTINLLCCDELPHAIELHVGHVVQNQLALAVELWHGYIRHFVVSCVQLLDLPVVQAIRPSHAFSVWI